MNQKIHELVERYEADRKHYLTDRYNETQVRSDFLDPLFELLGWDKESVYSGQFDEEWKDIEVQLQKSSIDTEFLRLINELKLAA